jgi:hypothetical protein
MYLVWEQKADRLTIQDNKDSAPPSPGEKAGTFKIHFKIIRFSKLRVPLL